MTKPGRDEAGTLLDRVDFFRRMEPELKKHLLKLVQLRRFEREGVILTQEEAGTSLYFIFEGRVKVVLYGEDGKEITLSTLGTGAFFGEMAMIDGEPRSASVVALEETGLLIITQKDFLGLIRRYPRVAIEFLSEMSRRLRKADEMIGSLALLDVAGRVARFLLNLAKEEGVQEAGGMIVSSRPTHQEIASRIGTTRETVTRVLGELVSRGYITIKGKKVIVHESLPPPARLSLR
ncbi:MAG: Crp/Fnr family transcriptional regulator [Proteobacteria bacterium]|jgi:CRP-like cAMP-binding protein|nr:Crp/Fnr family transcriptional regulator [Pseudomonadota bacterium]